MAGNNSPSTILYKNKKDILNGIGHVSISLALPSDRIVHALVDRWQDPAILLANVIHISYTPSSKVGQAKLLELSLCVRHKWHTKIKP